MAVPKLGGGDDCVAVLEGEQIIVAGDEVVRPGGEKGAENRQILCVAGAAARHRHGLHDVGLNGQNVNQVREIGWLPFQAMVQAR